MKKIIKTTLLVTLLLVNKNIVKAANYIWPIDEKNAYETYIEYGYGRRTYDSKAYDIKNPGGQLEGFYSKNENHYGVDITGKKGHTYDVISIVNGTVLTTSLDQLYNPSLSYIDRNQRNASFDGGGYGNYIVIKDDSSERCFLYGHLKVNTVTLRNGQKVKKGQKIGEMGSSGDSGHMHLHFEVRLNQSTTTTGKNLVITKSYGVETLNPIDYIGSKAPEKKIKVIEQPKQEIKEVKPFETKQNTIVNPKAQVTNVEYKDYSSFGKIVITLDKEIEAPEVNISIKSQITEKVESKKASYISKNKNEYTYTIPYKNFDILTYGTINLSIDNTNKLKNYSKDIGYLKEYKISRTYEDSYYKNPNEIDKYALGDLNKDGKIDSVDASQTLKLSSKLASGKTLTREEEDKASRADMNRDGKIDTTDASLILNYYSKRATSWEGNNQENIILCDLNSDRMVDSQDYKKLEHYENTENKYNARYDLNRDGVIDENDKIFFKQIIMKYGSR